ncbi:hypothetical protein [Mediterraneibacter gnavus]|uniref:hypothetical protein n=1 Tax=Mediterraneibacter gnavus TaxID=33038 RepID=UPI000463A904|nr:hypothetical protein [Mediterraneibacter gnavus]
MNTKMTERTYDDIYELCEDIVDTYCSGVCVIAKYEEAKRIITELCSMDLVLTSCILHNPEFEGYEDEYIIDIFSDEVWCEPAKCDDEYLYSNSYATYVLDNCNSKLLSKVETEHLYDVHIEDEDDNDINCCECCDPDYDECCGCSKFMNRDDDDDSCEIDGKDCHGFTASKSDDDGYHSVSFYSTERVDHDDMMDLLRIFGL